MKYFLYEEEENTGILTINRPDTLNSLNREVFYELDDILKDLAKKETLRVLIITGAGRAFVAGADIKEMQSMTPAEAKEFSILGDKTFKLINEFPMPVIAAVNGFALGGGLEFMMSADFAYASEKAKFGLPELTLGLIPGFGGSKRLSERVGVSAAKELLFTGRIIKPDEALRLGLVNKVVPPEELIPSVKELAKEIIKVSPNAVKEVKQLLNYSRDLPMDRAVAIENNQFGLIFSHPQAQEGMAAFVEKRKAEWNK